MELYIDANNNLVNGELLVGTRDDWKKGMMPTFKDWYNEYVLDNIKDDSILTLDEWVESVLDDQLESADDDVIQTHTRLN
jgi:hypothetical protein